MNIKLFLLFLIYISICGSDNSLHTIINNNNENTFLENLVTYYMHNMYDVKKGMIPDYPPRRFLDYINPTLIKHMHVLYNDFVYGIYIIKAEEVQYEGNRVEPYAIVFFGKIENLILARFRFLINENNNATLYTTSFLSEQCNKDVHQQLLKEMELFLKEKRVTLIKNETARFETNQFFLNNGYENRRGWLYKSIS